MRFGVWSDRSLSRAKSLVARLPGEPAPWHGGTVMRAIALVAQGVRKAMRWHHSRRIPAGRQPENAPCGDAPCEKATGENARYDAVRPPSGGWASRLPGAADRAHGWRSEARAWISGRQANCASSVSFRSGSPPAGEPDAGRAEFVPMSFITTFAPTFAIHPTTLQDPKLDKRIDIALTDKQDLSQREVVRFMHDG